MRLLFCLFAEDIGLLPPKLFSVLISADTDFGTILALRKTPKPSVILFRPSTHHHPDHQIRLLLANLTGFSVDLERGCIAVFEDTRIRLRPLSITD
jgi:predicted nuclease of predicted toxin-antitoxin system